MSLLRKAPKYVFVFAVIGVSSALFWFWWISRPKKTAQLPPSGPSAPSVPNRPPPPSASPVDKRAGYAEKVRGKFDRLLLVDNELYDMSEGKVVISEWLQHGMPRKLMVDPETNTLMALYPNARIRYALEGRETGRLPGPSEMFVSANERWALFIRDKDFWHADLDKASFKLVNEKRVTSLGQFWGSNLKENIMLVGEKRLVFRHQNNPLVITLESGEVKPLQIPTWQLESRRSPNGRYFVGIERGMFMQVDVDSDNVLLENFGNATMDGAQWLGNDRCIYLSSGRALMEFKRGAQDLIKLKEFAKPYKVIGFPSPNQRYLFVANSNYIVLVDLNTKKELPVALGSGHTWVTDDTYVFSRDTLDTTQRGTWLQRAGQAERRVSQEPFMVGQGENADRLPELGIAVAFTKRGMLKIPTDGQGDATPLPMAEPPKSSVRIEQWR